MSYAAERAERDALINAEKARLARVRAARKKASSGAVVETKHLTTDASGFVRVKPRATQKQAEFDRKREIESVCESIRHADNLVGRYKASGDTVRENHWREIRRGFKAKLRKLTGGSSVTAQRGAGHVLNNARIGELRARRDVLRNIPRADRTKKIRTELKAVEAELGELTARDRRVSVSTNNSSRDMRRVGTVAGRASKAGPATRVQDADGTHDSSAHVSAERAENVARALSNGRTDEHAGLPENADIRKHVWEITDSTGTWVHSVDRVESAPRRKPVGPSGAHVKGAPHTHNGVCHLSGSRECLPERLDEYK